MNYLEEIFGTVISAYTRADAIEDGTLIDVSELFPDTVRRFFRLPLCVSIGVWSLIENAAQANDQSEAVGMLGYVLAGALQAARQNPDTNRVCFSVPLRELDGDSVKIIRPDLILHVGPDDDGQACFTLMTPSED